MPQQLRRRAIPKHQRGYTLVELMYATGYFMLGLTGLVCFQLVAATGTSRAADIMMATNLTSATIESTRVMSINTVLTASQPQVTTYSRAGSQNGTPTYFTVYSTATQASGKAYYELQVSTQWQMPGNSFQHNITMQTRIPTE